MNVPLQLTMAITPAHHNEYLFSDHYLDNLLPQDPRWEAALAIDERAFGPDHPKVAVRVNNLGGVLHTMGDLAGARAAFERALRIFEKFLPPEHPSIRTVRGNLEVLDRAARGEE